MHLTSRLGPLVARAATRHHLLSTRELLAGGLHEEDLRRLVRDGVLERVVRGLYRVAGTRTKLQDVAAAVRRHRGARASHVTGLWLASFDIAFAPRPHLTLPPGATSRTSIGQLHRSHLPTVDGCDLHGIPSTTIARSLVDSAGQMSVERLHTLVASAIADRRTSIAELSSCLARVEAEPGRKGSGVLRAVLADWTDALRPDSVAEAVAIRRIAAFGIQEPVTQYEVFDDDGRLVARLDLAWPDDRVGREYDSDRFHGPGRAEADERRRRRLEALGWTIGVIHRGHLLPSREDWLHDLAADLRRRAA